MVAAENGKIQHGLANVYFAETSITEIDGDRGVLRHRGMPIEELARHPFERLAFLLLEGTWPTEEQLQAFCDEQAAFRQLPDEVLNFISSQASSPADIALQTTLSFLCMRQDIPDSALISIAPSIVAAHAAVQQDDDLLPPEEHVGLPADSLRRITGRAISDLEARIINLDFVLHADHGANASTFAGRVATSAGAGVLRGVVAAMATFSGSRHGGAVAGVAEMLDAVETSDIASFVNERTKAGLPVMGFGHRVYKVEDPRASLFRNAAHELANAKNDRSMLEKAEALVDAMKDYERVGIGPNVDLYAAVIYRLLGIRLDQFTAMFACARMAGWIAQIREQKEGSNVLIRPRLRYTSG